MNKETRQFTLGIIGIICCSLGLVSGYVGMANSITLETINISSFLFNFLFVLFEALGIIISLFYVIKNI